MCVKNGETNQSIEGIYKKLVGRTELEGGGGGGGEEKREREGEGDQLDLDLIKTSRTNFFPLSLPLLHSIHIVSGSSLRCIAKNAFSSPSSNAA